MLLFSYRTLALLSACAYIPMGRKCAFNNDVRLIPQCVLIGKYGVWTTLIERVVRTGSGCVLVREYAFMRNMRLITREYGIV